MIDFSDLNEKVDDEDRCGGPEGCPGRKFDAAKEDCLGCLRGCEADPNEGLYYY